MKTVNRNQLDFFSSLGYFEIKNPEASKDSRGRTREDIAKASKSLNPKILDSITLKNGEYYIEGKLADEWIAQDESLHEKDEKYWNN